MCDACRRPEGRPAAASMSGKIPSPDYLFRWIARTKLKVFDLMQEIR
jgi:hypothetical protein